MAKSAAVPIPEHSLLTVKQVEERHPGFKGRLRSYIHRSDSGDPIFSGLRLAVVRIGRSLFLSDEALRKWIDENRAASGPAPPRNRRVDIKRRKT